jgi:hypothetical protein
LEEVYDFLLDLHFQQWNPGREFANKIIQNLADIWPGMKLVHGKPRHLNSVAEEKLFFGTKVPQEHLPSPRYIDN